VTVNWRFFGDVSRHGFDDLVANLAAGALDGEVPPHGTLSRVRRTVGLAANGTSIHGAGGPDPALPESATPSNPSPDAFGGVDLGTSATTPAVASLDGGPRRRTAADPNFREP
jgi:hypothetical protein